MTVLTSAPTDRKPPRAAARGTPLLLAACAALAAASLAVPAELGYDPWAWLVWGREVTRGELSTAGGPTWKPFPVLVTTALSYLGDAAPALWLVLSRAGGLFAMVLAYRLAARFAGPVAGAVAVAALLLTPDDESRWIRHLLQGNVEPLTVALCLWAVQSHLDGGRVRPFLLGGVAALLRPEAWPFLALYAVWLLWAERSRWLVVVPTVLVVLVTVPGSWFGGDWLASGDPLTGAHTARVLDGGTAARVVLAMEQAGNAVLVPVWVAAAVGFVWAAHRREPAPVVLGVGALTWMAVVGAMAGVFGFAALSRFLAPAAAVLCVLAGIGSARVVTAVDHIGYRLTAALLLVVVTAPFAAPRVEWVGNQLASADDRARFADDLDRAVATAGGREAMLACGQLAIDATEPVVQQARPALAWQLDVPLARIGYSLSGPGVAIVPGTGAPGATPAVPPAPQTQVLARTPGWVVLAAGCIRE